MITQRNACLAIAVIACLLLGADWLRFRGPNGSGVAQDELPEARRTRGHAIVWKVELPGRGVSGPIVIGDQVALTCCTGYHQDRLHVVCLDTGSGVRRWERQLWATGSSTTHPKTCTAASTPASDGQRIFAYFSTNDVACFDLEGNLLWLRGLMLQYPNASNSLGLASSPIVVGDILIVKIDTDTQSLALGIDTATGQTRWTTDRPKLASWTSPVLLRGAGDPTPLVVLQSGRGLAAYDPRHGHLAWKTDRGCATIPSNVARDDVLYVPSNGLIALRQPPGNGKPEVIWESARLSPSTCTPLCYRGKIFVVSRSILKCADAATGTLLWQLRLKGNLSSSPVAAAGYLYCFNEEGLGQIVDVTPKRGRIAGQVDLGETILASPAIADGALYVRSDHHLWKIVGAAPE